MTELLKNKVKKLATLLQADNYGVGESQELGWEWYVRFDDVKVGATAKQHGGTGDVEIKFHTLQAMHSYLDDKIKLFGTSK